MVDECSDKWGLMGSGQGLTISSTLSLPIEAVTETFAILAKRGKGKTNTAVVMAEEMISAGQPVVVIDPVGVWWGLRTSADGKRDGLPIVIFGGDHADVPLEPTAGELIADVVVERRISALIDLSSLSKSASRRFMEKFVERIYHRNREPLHIIIDEADAFAPQRSMGGDGARLLGAMEDLVRRGRARGIGCTLITQRPAVLHKDILTQAEVLIALGMTGPRDVAAIDEWVRLHADEAEAREVKQSLPSLPVGTAWVWSPGWLDVLQKVQIRARKTFDSSATPRPGVKRVVPQKVARVDLELLGEQIAATVERIESEDPKHLKVEVSRLRREVERLQREAKVVPPSEPEVVEVSVLDPADREALVNCWEQIEALQQQMARVLEKVSAAAPSVPVPVPARVQKPARAPRRVVEETTLDPSEPRQTSTLSSGPGVKLSKAERSILTVLAQYGDRTTSEIAMRAGYTVGGAFNNAMGSLRSKGYVLRGSPVSITPEGLEALGPLEALPTGWALAEHFLANKTLKMGKAHRLILEYLRTCDEPQTAQQIADATGYAIGGAFNNAMGRLRSLELVITMQGQNYIADELMED